MRDGMVDELVSVGASNSRPIAGLRGRHLRPDLELHGMLAGGHEVALCSTRRIPDEAKEAADCSSRAKRRPLYFADAIVSPQSRRSPLYNKIYDGFRRGMSDGKKAGDKAIGPGAQAKRRYVTTLPPPSFVEKIQHSILDALILKKVRGLGGEVKSAERRRRRPAFGQRIHRGHRHPDDLWLWSRDMPVLPKNNPLTPKPTPDRWQALKGVQLKCIDPAGQKYQRRAWRIGCGTGRGGATGSVPRKRQKCSTKIIMRYGSRRATGASWRPTAMSE